VVQLRVQVRGVQSELQIPGKVVSVNVGAAGASGPGMGVRFSELTEEQQKTVDELYEHSAFSFRK
jgi:Tfp pilus assembly protein PilZ